MTGGAAMTGTVIAGIALLTIVGCMVHNSHTRTTLMHARHLMHPLLLAGGSGKTGYRTLQWSKSQQQHEQNGQQSFRESVHGGRS